MLDFQSEGGLWGRWHRHWGRGCPAWIVGSFVEVRTVYDFTGSARDGLGGYGVAGVDLIESWKWTWESRMAAPGTALWSESQPIDLYRLWLRGGAAVDQVGDAASAGAAELLDV